MKRINFLNKFYFAGICITSAALAFGTSSNLPPTYPSSKLATTQSTDQPFVVIGNHTISKSAYYHRMAYLSGVGTIEGKHLINMPPGLITLDRMITEQLILILAKSKGVSPTEDQIQQLYRDGLAKNPNLLTDYEASGHTKEDLMFHYKLQAAKFNILTQGIIVTNQEVSDEYTNNPSEFTIPKLVHLRIIVVDSDAAKTKVDQELASDKPFAQVASENSIDITKVRGGDYGNVPEASLSKEFKSALQGVKIGGTSDWFSDSGDQSNLMIKIYFENATPAKLLPLTDTLKDQIRKQLMLQKGSLTHHIEKDIDSLRYSEKITINNPIFQKAYQDLIDQEKKASQSGKTSLVNRSSKTAFSA